MSGHAGRLGHPVRRPRQSSRGLGDARQSVQGASHLRAVTHETAPQTGAETDELPGPVTDQLTDQLTDQMDDLLDRARGGETEAFGELFDLFHGLVFRQLFAQTRSRALAEDLTSETFFKALRAVPAFSLPSRLFGPWLRRIARNLAADHYKSNRTRLELVTSDLSFYEGVTASTEELLVERLDQDALREGMRRLPENQRRAVALRFLRQLSIAETAEELGCTEGAAKQLQWRGLRNLAQLLDDDGPG